MKIPLPDRIKAYQAGIERKATESGFAAEVLDQFGPRIRDLLASANSTSSAELEIEFHNLQLEARTLHQKLFARNKTVSEGYKPGDRVLTEAGSATVREALLSFGRWTVSVEIDNGRVTHGTKTGSAIKRLGELNADEHKRYDLCVGLGAYVKDLFLENMVKDEKAPAYARILDMAFQDPQVIADLAKEAASIEQKTGMTGQLPVLETRVRELLALKRKKERKKGGDKKIKVPKPRIFGRTEVGGLFLLALRDNIWGLRNTADSPEDYPKFLEASIPRAIRPFISEAGGDIVNDHTRKNAERREDEESRR
ncbi:MAG: hypothetical protein HOO67_03935 [Candidatus Peribacteraceae bacterium]|nr:hypothetical protein [Candidatus Peribacteraceae bacterium]